MKISERDAGLIISNLLSAYVAKMVIDEVLEESKNKKG
jgi:hypothetical protein